MRNLFLYYNQDNTEKEGHYGILRSRRLIVIFCIIIRPCFLYFSAFYEKVLVALNRTGKEGHYGYYFRLFSNHNISSGLFALRYYVFSAKIRITTLFVKLRNQFALGWISRGFLFFLDSGELNGKK